MIFITETGVLKTHRGHQWPFLAKVPHSQRHKRESLHCHPTDFDHWQLFKKTWGMVVVSETNETLTRSNISTNGITWLIFEEHLVDTLLGCFFQSSLLPPSTRHSLHCQNERSRQPIAKMRLIQVISMPRTNQSIRITSHPPTRLLYVYIYIPTAVQPTSIPTSGLPPSPNHGEGVDIGGRRRGNATELLRVEPTRPVDWF